MTHELRAMVGGDKQACERPDAESKASTLMRWIRKAMEDKACQPNELMVDAQGGSPRRQVVKSLGTLLESEWGN